MDRRQSVADGEVGSETSYRLTASSSASRELLPSSSSSSNNASTTLLVPQRKNRNKKALTLGSAAAMKPGTLTGSDAADLLANSSNNSRSSTRRSSTGPPVQVAARHGRRPSHTDSMSTTSQPLVSSPLLPSTPSLSSSSTASSALSTAMASLDLELGVEFKLDLRNEDLVVIDELGAGNGGTVERVKHVPTGVVMAKKVVHTASAPSSTRKQILRELQIMHDCSSRYIVSFYGAYLMDPHVVMCMEYMDKGSLDAIYRKVGPIPEPILAQIAWSVVQGLRYLYETHKIMHRDVKPSNILLNSAGFIKICDFGVSGELINSVADTFVGTSTYMSPERISGDPYTVKSDVWSLGITLVELGIGRFPFAPDDGTSGGGGGGDDGSGGEDDEAADVFKLYGLGEEGDAPPAEDTLSPVPPGKKEESVELAERRRAAKRERDESARRSDSGGTITSRGGDDAASRRSATIDPSRPNTTQRRPPPPPRAPPRAPPAHHQMSILELLQYIVNEPAPRLPAHDGRFSTACRHFVDACLRKEPVGWNVRKQGPLPRDVARPTPKDLLTHPWMLEASTADTDTEAFASTIY